MMKLPKPSGLPDPTEVIMMVIPTEQLKKTPLMLEIQDMSTLVRVVRWGELVSMVLNDSRVADLAKWMKMLGMSVPSSPDVYEAEVAESDIRLDRIDHLLPVIEPMIRVLSVPAMVQMVATLARAEMDSSGHVSKETAAAINAAVTEALRQSAVGVISALVDFDLLLINDLQQPETTEDNDDEEDE